MNTANRVVITTTTGAKTRALGRRLARLLRAGDVLLLQGPLGAGKTTLAQGIGAGLKVDEPVRSPTFVLMTHHEGGALPLYHADLYRLETVEEVEDLSLDEQAADGVLLVEWPERGLDALPAHHLLVVLEPVPDEPTSRRITVVAVGDRYRRVLDGLLAAGLADRV
ncbi:MAG: tRNA (adenosine(37)-N6)-threonylcarbamoyltransferase complex ATPase subunit type 1 TsaE [Dehalococcoidia bacterium]